MSWPPLRYSPFVGSLANATLGAPTVPSPTNKRVIDNVAGIVIVLPLVDTGIGPSQSIKTEFAITPTPSQRHGALSARESPHPTARVPHLSAPRPSGAAESGFALSADADTATRSAAAPRRAVLEASLLPRHRGDAAAAGNGRRDPHPSIGVRIRGDVNHLLRAARQIRRGDRQHQTPRPAVWHLLIRP